MAEDDSSEPTPSSSGLDWDKLFKMAEDPDMDELLRSPLDSAIKTLEDGKEVAKLTAIRSLPDLLESDGEDCIHKFIPAIQRSLREEKSNLDMHCEAAIVFKAVMQNEQLVARFPGLMDTLLDNILQNIVGQRESLSSTTNKVEVHLGPTPQVHNMNAAAWLETLVEIANRVPTRAVKQYIVPVLQQQAEPHQRVQRRIIATKLLNKLAEILSPNDVRKELGPTAQLLCQDSNANVRTAMANRLAVIAAALKNESDVVSLVLPSFVELCKDEDPTVRETCLGNISKFVPYFTKDAKRNTIFPMIRKTSEEYLDKKTESLIVICKNLGEWAYMMKDVLDQLDLSWVLNTYCKLVNISQNSKEKGASAAVFTMCRRMCAFNLPCMVHLFPKSFDRLEPFFEAFCTDSDDEVRMAMAAAFHEILQLQPTRHQLVFPFIELIRSGAPEVVAKITFNLDKILPTLYSCASNSNGVSLCASSYHIVSSNFMTLAKMYYLIVYRKIQSAQLDRIVIGCNQLLRGTGSWRGHEALLKHLEVLTNVVPFTTLNDTFIPVLQKEVLQVRAIPCRIAASRTLLLFMRQQAEAAKRMEVINFLKADIANHTCSYRRSLFIDVVQCVLDIFSRRFFIEHFLKNIVKLTRDPISNIRDVLMPNETQRATYRNGVHEEMTSTSTSMFRIRSIRMLPRIKRRLILPDDDALLMEMEKAVGDALVEEENNNTRLMLQQTACELSRTESMSKDDSEDKRRVSEEDKLWREERVAELAKELKEKEKEKEKSAKAPKPSSLRPPEPVREKSPWRTQRRAVAVVRPQPIVVMRSPSPAPMLKNDGRSSRLPISTTTLKEKEDLKKAATESLSSRSTATRSNSSSNIRKAMSTSTSSVDTSSNSSSTSSLNGYRSGGLQRSSTTTTGFGSISSSHSSYALMSSRSSSNLRRPTYGLTRVSSHSTLERKPPSLSFRIRSEF